MRGNDRGRGFPRAVRRRRRWDLARPAAASGIPERRLRARPPRDRRGSPRAGLAIAVAVAVAAAGCAPQLDGPLERQRAIDRDDGDRLAAQLAALPGAVAANVVLHHAFRDPLAAAPPGPATLAAVITVDDRADRAAIRAAATRLARAAVPELATAAAPATEPITGPVPEPMTGPAIVIDAAVHRPVLARVGPFSVEDSSRAPLKLALALGCATIAALAAALALRAGRHRRGNSAQ